jgi:hypothetical protein
VISGLTNEYIGRSSFTARGSSTSSTEAFTTMRDWIKNCDETHTECKKVVTGPTTPQFPAGRIIDVGIGRGSHVKLVSGHEVSSNAKYISLSHCWGDAKPPKLTKGTVFQEYQQKIEPATLPSTFADAIDVTQQLGVRYIWIDCLCIIQDDADDWRHESAKMAQIYAGAWLDIAATRARDAYGGLYSLRELRDLMPLVLIRLHFDWHYHDSWRPNYVLFDNQIWDSHVDNSDLMHRAWVQQEQLLSRRTIHFTKNQVFWRCRQLQACEVFVDGMPKHGKSGRAEYAHRVLSLSEEDAYSTAELQHELVEYWSENRPNIVRWDQELLSHSNYHSGDKFFATWERSRILLETWSDIVLHYSAAHLTFPDKDKLVALSGLARRCGRGSDYLAGLWRPLLAWHLLWRIPEYRTALPETRLHGIPSWSWASMYGRVRLYHKLEFYHPSIGSDLPLIKVASAETFLVGPDPFGQEVNGGRIELSGHIMKVPYLAVQQTLERWKGQSYYMYIDDDLGRSSRMDSMIYCLAIVKGDLLTISNHRVTTVEGLWIEPTDGGFGEYRRRDVFALPVEGTLLWPEALHAFLVERLRKEECVSYDEMQVYEGPEIEGQHRRYSITLV